MEKEEYNEEELYGGERIFTKPEKKKYNLFSIWIVVFLAFLIELIFYLIMLLMLQALGCGL